MNQKKGHGLWMLVGCLIPIAAILVYSYLSKGGSFNFRGQGYASLLFLLCPLMMLFMMRGMHGHGGSGADCHDNTPGSKTHIDSTDKQ
ncbi:MAG: DUF2933 domain-containing protein [Bacillota bacterium]